MHIVTSSLCESKENETAKQMIPFLKEPAIHFEFILQIFSSVDNDVWRTHSIPDGKNYIKVMHVPRWIRVLSTKSFENRFVWN